MLYGHVYDSHDEELVYRHIKATRAAFQKDPEGNGYSIPYNMINTFCMYSDYTPLTLEEWIRSDAARRGG